MKRLVIFGVTAAIVLAPVSLRAQDSNPVDVATIDGIEIPLDEVSTRTAWKTGDSLTVVREGTARLEEDAILDGIIKGKATLGSILFARACIPRLVEETSTTLRVPKGFSEEIRMPDGVNFVRQSQAAQAPDGSWRAVVSISVNFSEATAAVKTTCTV